jgi:hypothetical protein
MTTKQNYADLMTQHGLKGICNVDNTKSSYSKASSKLPSAMSIELFG